MKIYTRFQDPPPTREFHFAYGAVGAGTCASCGDIRSLFVHSAFHDATSEPVCFRCITNYIVREYRDADERDEYSLKMMWYDYHSIWTELEGEIQFSRAEVLAHELGCQACARFSTPQGLVEATSTKDFTQGRVHSSCTHGCGDCNVTYYTPYNTEINLWSYSRPSDFMFRVSTARSIKWVCNPCFEQYDGLSECGNCGAYEFEDELFYYDFADERVCRSCSNSVERCSDCDTECWDLSDHECDERYSLIKSWDFRPSGGFTFHGSDANRLFMGFELEVEAEHADREEGAALANHHLEMSNRGYLKYDGSIEDGFEIVTQPHTLDEYMQNFPWLIMDELREQGFRSWDTETCGFHVHVNREAFGWRKQGEFNRGKYEAHLLRFTKLIYDNQRHVRKIAGRSSQRWASYEDAKNLTRKIKTGYQSNSRYSAVNVANTHTIEVRVFKGSLAVPRIKTYLQFVHSVTEYTRDLHVSPRENNLMWTRYRGWLAKHDEKYPELVSFLSTRTDEQQGDN